MKKNLKIGIITINDNNNYGNRLQNYAVQETIRKMGKYDVITLKNSPRFNNRCGIINFFKKIIAHLYSNIRKWIKDNKNRRKCFKDFNKKIRFSKRIKTIYSKLDNEYDFIVAGSDQIWKPTYGRMSQMDLLAFATPYKRLSFSASFGVESLSASEKILAKKELEKFNAISVREEAGKKIVDDLDIGKKVEVLIDPTMMLDSCEWEKVMKKPAKLESKRYVLTYFLGNMSEEKENEIKRFAKKHDCDIINLLNKDDIFYETGPSEFLYLEKNAFLICTDSFHSCVFSILFDRPFVVFEREGNIVNMNSRIDTLLSKFELESKRYNGSISDEYLSCDYIHVKEILKKEKEKTECFLRRALNIKDGI